MIRKEGVKGDNTLPVATCEEECALEERKKRLEQKRLSLFFVAATSVYSFILSVGIFFQHVTFGELNALLLQLALLIWVEGDARSKETSERKEQEAHNALVKRSTLWRISPQRALVYNAYGSWAAYVVLLLFVPSFAFRDVFQVVFWFAVAMSYIWSSAQFFWEMMFAREDQKLLEE